MRHNYIYDVFSFVVPLKGLANRDKYIYISKYIYDINIQSLVFRFILVHLHLHFHGH